MLYKPTKHLTMCGAGCGAGFGSSPPWTPAALGATVLQYWDPTLGITAAPTVSAWVATIGGGTQAAAGAAQPALATQPSGRQCLSFDGVGNYTSCAFTLAVPRHILISCAIDTSVSGTVFDGSSGNTCRLYVTGATSVACYSATAGPSITVATNTWCVLDFVSLAGAPWMKGGVNGGALATAGTNTAGTFGLRLGAYGGGGSYSKVKIADVLVCTGELASADRAAAVAYMRAKGGF